MKPTNPQTTNEEAKDGLKYFQIENIIPTLPPEDELGYRDLALHVRAYNLGVLQGEHQAKQRILHQFQMIMFGHIL